MFSILEKDEIIGTLKEDYFGMDENNAGTSLVS